MKKSFSLIELLFVLAIIGILASIVVPRYIDYGEKARASEAIVIIDMIKQAEVVYMLETGGLVDMTEPGWYTKLNLPQLASSDADAVAANKRWYYSVTAQPVGSELWLTIGATRASSAGSYAGRAIILTIVHANNNRIISSEWTGDHLGTPRL